MATSAVIEESLQDKWQRLSRIVAVAVGSRGSRLSVFEIARRSSFMVAALIVLKSEQTVKGLKSALKRVAKLLIIGGKVNGVAPKRMEHTARVAKVVELAN